MRATLPGLALADQRIDTGPSEVPRSVESKVNAVTQQFRYCRIAGTPLKSRVVLEMGLSPTSSQEAKVALMAQVPLMSAETKSCALSACNAWVEGERFQVGARRPRPCWLVQRR